MSNDVLSREATALLKQLRSATCMGAFDRAAAEELVSRGLAVRVPTTGEIEVTEAGRTGSLDSGGGSGGERLSEGGAGDGSTMPLRAGAQS